jgi:hypothetical protein
MRDYADLLDKMKGQLVGLYAARTKRPADEIAKLMDDETWFTADEAVAAGFADRTSAQLAMAASIDPARFNHSPPNLLRGESPMAKEIDTPSTPFAEIKMPGPAAFADMRNALPGADATFLCSQLEANATVAQAQSAWIAEQNRRLDAANKAAEAAQTKAAEAEAKAAAQKSGLAPLGKGSVQTSSDEGVDPIAQFNALVAARIATGQKKAKAVSNVIAENPDLHAEYLAAYNAAHNTARK